jgi:hypothetical protein
MNRSVFVSVTLLFSTLAAGCLDAAAGEEELDGRADPDEEATEPAEEPAPRMYNIIEEVLPAGDHDGRAGVECVALLNPENRLRKIILVEPVRADGSCGLARYAAGGALSFAWDDTSVYSISAGIAALRARLGDKNGAVHLLTGGVTSEEASLVGLEVFSTLPTAQQASQAATFSPRRVHSLYDFEGEEQVKAEAAYQAVRVSEPCEQPGAPRLESRTFAGFVYGYTASNLGRCQGRGFSRRHTYDRSWRLIGTLEYLEERPPGESER